MMNQPPQIENKSNKQTIGIVTTCADDWGGCEELWSKSIPYLQNADYNVSVYKNKINRNHPEYVKLINKDVTLIEIDQVAAKKATPASRLNSFLRKRKKSLRDEYEDYLTTHPFTKIILLDNPCLVVISQSINFDGTEYGYLCALLNIPYIMIAQKAVDFFWPASKDRDAMKVAFTNALHCFFVSNHNRLLTEEQLGIRFKNASVIFNPVKVNAVIPYPATDNELRLACVARLFVIDKGQDILLRVLAQNKWKDRCLKVSLIGEGDDERTLREMADLLALSNVEFIGVVDDFNWICENHHAFILPSRSEGMPLVVLEAMASGRMVIATNAGGNAEIIQDGITGYLAAISETSLDDAMERAWNNRLNWQNIGKIAAKYIMANIPACPEADFADRIFDLIKKL